MSTNAARSLKPTVATRTDPFADLALGGLEGLLGYHLRRAHSAMHRDFLDAMAEYDITQKQMATLCIICANPGVSQIRIAGELDMDRATMMAIVDRLELRGLVLRRRSKTDRRRQELFLTPKGEKTLKAAKAKVAEHERRFRALFDEPELEALVAALRRFYE